MLSTVRGDLASDGVEQRGVLVLLKALRIITKVLVATEVPSKAGVLTCIALVLSIIQRLGIYCRAQLETWHILPSEVGDLASIAEQSQRLGIYCRAELETWHLLPSKVGDLAYIAEQSQRLGINCQARSDTWYQVLNKVGELASIAKQSLRLSAQ